MRRIRPTACSRAPRPAMPPRLTSERPCCHVDTRKEAHECSRVRRFVRRTPARHHRTVRPPRPIDADRRGSATDQRQNDVRRRPPEVRNRDVADSRGGRESPPGRNVGFAPKFWRGGGVRRAHAGGDMPGNRGSRGRSFSAADLRPGRCRSPCRTPPPDRRRDGERRRQPSTTTARARRSALPAPPTAASGRRIPARGRTGTGGRPAHDTRPGGRFNAPRAGPPPAGIVAAELAGPPHPAIAAWRKRGPTHGSPCNRPHPSRHRAHRRAHGHIYREHTPHTPKGGPPAPRRVPPAANHRIPARRSSGALSAPRPRSGKGLDSRHPTRDP